VLTVTENVWLRACQETVTSSCSSVTESALVPPSVEPAALLELPSVLPPVLEEPEVEPPPSVVVGGFATAAVVPVVASSYWVKVEVQV
jgi:hypothetical protein